MPKKRPHHKKKPQPPKPPNAPVKVDVAPKLPRLYKPSKFSSTAELCNYAKAAVYQITRIRDGRSVTLGTAFLAGKNRMITCAHCINNPEQPDEPMAHHQDGDLYCLLQLDEDNNSHYAYVDPELNKELFVYPTHDIAVIYLKDNFYGADGDYYQHPDRFLELSAKPRSIGTDIVILGYPIQQLEFDENGAPKPSSVIFRGDFGVVNTRYGFMDDNIQLEQYHFTVPFNPGNSGGPILDRTTGKVIGIVKGSLSIPVRQIEDDISDVDEAGNEITYKQKSIVKTTYSVGYSMANCHTFAEQHGLPLSKKL